MRVYIAIAMFLLLSAAMYGQDVRSILTKSRQKCQSVRNGYYEMTKFMKYPTETDTVRTIHICHFRKLVDDTLFSSAFHSKSYWKDSLRSEALYTGDDLVRLNVIDSTATIMAKSLWATDIEAYSHNYTFYSPLTDRKSWPLPVDSSYADNRHTFKFIGVEAVGAVSCYHIQMDVAPRNESTDDMKESRNEYHFWISKNDYIPVQFSAMYDFSMGNDTMHQYEISRIDTYELNTLKDDDAVSLKSIPSYAKLSNYVPHKLPESLALSSSAPDWELYSLKDKKVSLRDMRGQLVLVDFFYRSCYPCMLALPVLQALHEKYKDRGLNVVGIDPFDTKNEMIPFLSKRGITYTVLLGGMDASKDYRVTGYPSLFLIDKQGRIIFSELGFGEDLKDKLEALIVKHL